MWASYLKYVQYWGLCGSVLVFTTSLEQHKRCSILFTSWSLNMSAAWCLGRQHTMSLAATWNFQLCCCNSRQEILWSVRLHHRENVWAIKPKQWTRKSLKALCFFCSDYVGRGKPSFQMLCYQQHYNLTYSKYSTEWVTCLQDKLKWQIILYSAKILH